MTGAPSAVPEGLVNFRDLGGVPVAGGGRVAPGRVYRSDSLSYATDADADLLVDTLGIGTVVDLREDREIEAFGLGPVAERRPRYVRAGLGDVPAGTTRSEFYAAMLAQRAPDIGGVIRALTGPGAMPAVVHCHIGLDRTGVLSAAILGLAGAGDDAIAADYARSAADFDAVIARARERRARLGLPRMDDAYYAAATPRPAVMEETLARVRQRWGGFEGWAGEAGLTATDVRALRERLVEPSSN